MASLYSMGVYLISMWPIWTYMPFTQLLAIVPMQRGLDALVPCSVDQKQIDEVLTDGLSIPNNTKYNIALLAHEILYHGK